MNSQNNHNKKKRRYQKLGEVGSRGKRLEKHVVFPFHLCRLSVTNSFAQYLQDLGPTAYGNESERFKLQRAPKIKKQPQQLQRKWLGRA